ncbi:hypothetical protein HDR58_01140 [bacterium]|nr:hypothetical protein [bacterium]
MNLVSMVPKVFNYGKRIANVAPEAIFGTSTELAGTAMRNTKGSLLTKAKAGFKAVENDVFTKQAAQGGFLKRLYTNLKNTPKDVLTSIKTSSSAAKAAGKNSLWGGIKGFGSGIGKKMPFIGAVMYALFELPNICTAVKEKDLWQGVKEIGKAGSKLGGGAVGAAIGSAICPGIGSLVGWIAGEWVAGKIVGKSYSEEKAEKEQEQLAQLQEQMSATQNQQVPFMGNSQYNTPNLDSQISNYNNPYADDLMMQQQPFNMIA